MQKKQDEHKSKRTMNLVLGLALLFFAVILAVNGVQKIRAAAVFSAIMAICGVLLFGGVGLMLLIGELRRWHRPNEQEGTNKL